MGPPHSRTAGKDEHDGQWKGAESAEEKVAPDGVIGDESAARDPADDEPGYQREARGTGEDLTVDSRRRGACGSCSRRACSSCSSCCSRRACSSCSRRGLLLLLTPSLLLLLTPSLLLLLTPSLLLLLTPSLLLLLAPSLLLLLAPSLLLLLAPSLLLRRAAVARRGLATDRFAAIETAGLMSACARRSASSISAFNAGAASLRSDASCSTVALRSHSSGPRSPMRICRGRSR